MKIIKIMIKLILNKIFSKCKVFEKERISNKNINKYSYNKDKARYIFAKKFIIGNRILNIACGEGYGSALLSQNNDHFIYGLDLSEKAISFAKANFINKKLTFYVGDAYNTKFENNLFTSIVSIETLEHLKDHAGFLSELRRILKKDGLLIISSSEKVIKDKFFDNPHHINLLYKDGIENLLKKYFTVTAIYCQAPLIKNPSFMLYPSLAFSSIFLSRKIVKDRSCLTGTNCIFICRNNL
ncbi:MAG: class I SAM-dependent methyltransferase [Candidatus Omnitrophota bacterium]